jgi:hypothetical protein
MALFKYLSPGNVLGLILFFLEAVHCAPSFQSLNTTVAAIPEHMLGVSHSIAQPDISTSDFSSNEPGGPSAVDIPSASRLAKRETGPVGSSDRTYPWTCVGKVSIGHVEGPDSNPRYVLDLVSSGALVAPGVVLTFSQYMPWDQSKWWIRFVPALNNVAGANNEPFNASYVETFHGYKSPSTSGHDYVVLKLYQPLGHSTGWFGSFYSNNAADYDINSPVWTATGYPTNLGVFTGSKMADEQSVAINQVLFDTPHGLTEARLAISPGVMTGSANAGWVGGPLWGFSSAPKILGVLSGEWRDGNGKVHQTFAGGNLMNDLVSWGRVNWPA